MNKALMVLDDGQKIDVSIQKFEVAYSLFSKPRITFSGTVTGHHSGTSKFEVTKIIFNNPATVVFWSDGTKTVVKCSKNDTFDPEIGLAMAICKKAFGNTGAYNEVFKKWVPESGEQGRAVSVDEMRRQLVEYCSSRSCNNCRLRYAVCRCGRGAYFTCSEDDSGYMTDAEIREAYKKVFGK